MSVDINDFVYKNITIVESPFLNNSVLPMNIHRAMVQNYILKLIAVYTKIFSAAFAFETGFEFSSF